MKEFVDSEITLPVDISVVEKGIYEGSDITDLKDLKLVIYIDSLSCGSCRIAHFIDMLPLYELADTDGRFSVMAIFSPRIEDLPDIERRLMLLDFPYPIYIDTFGEFAVRNRIPSDERFHEFLIDKDGKVKFVGNPLSTEQLESVFKNTLNTLN